jgi:zinc/manganese transport system permease protein
MLITSSLAVAGPSLDPLSDLNQLTAYPFMVNALEAGTIVAVMAGVVGWFMVLRRQTFAGHTLSVMAFPGATGALLIGLSAAEGYFVFSGLAALIIGAAAGVQTRRNRVQESAITGTVQAFGLACGFLFLSLYQGVLANYESLLFGSFLGITHGQVLALAVVAAVALGLLAIAGRPLLFASLDESVARAHGAPTRALSLGFLLLLGLAVAETAQITGAL